MRSRCTCEHASDGLAGSGEWGWRFAGHHLSLHYTVVGGKLAAATPSFFGADPAEAPLPGGGLLRPCAALEDLGRELARSLDQAQHPCCQSSRRHHNANVAWPCPMLVIARPG